jgi:hypothetical protein
MKNHYRMFYGSNQAYCLSLGVYDGHRFLGDFYQAFWQVCLNHLVEGKETNRPEHIHIHWQKATIAEGRERVSCELPIERELNGQSWRSWMGGGRLKK